jgi:hypothetical protein
MVRQSYAEGIVVPPRFIIIFIIILFFSLFGTFIVFSFNFEFFNLFRSFFLIYLRSYKNS